LNFPTSPPELEKVFRLEEGDLSFSKILVAKWQESGQLTLRALMVSYEGPAINLLTAVLSPVPK